MPICAIPRCTRSSELDNIIGLSNYLTGGCTPPEAFQATPMANLAFMASGPFPPNAADLLGGCAAALVAVGGSRGVRSDRH